MKQALKNKTQLIFLLIAVAVAIALYSRLDMEQIKTSFGLYFARGWEGRHFWLLFLAALMVLANVSLDARKWQLLLGSIRSTSFWSSLSMSMRGIATSLIAPNRTGDFIGRIQYLEKQERWPAFFLSGLSSMLQLAATVLFGIIALVWFQREFDVFQYPVLHYWWLVPLAVLVLWFVRKPLLRIIGDSRYFPKWKDRLAVMGSVEKEMVAHAFLLSILRYLLFITQLYFIYLGLGLETSWSEVLMGQSAVYISLAFIPHSLLLDAAFRGPLSVYFFGFMGYASAEILIGAYLLYVLNILLPAFIGLFFFGPSFKMKKINMKYTIFLLCAGLTLISLNGWSQGCGSTNTNYKSGELLRYKVEYSLAGAMVTAGYADFSVKEENIRGKKVLHLSGTGRSTSSFDKIYRVRDYYESWINPSTNLPYRFQRNILEGSTRIQTEVDFKHAARLAKSTLGTFRIKPCTQDVMSALYWARTIDYTSMKIGEKKEFDLFLDDELHHLYIQYLGTEVIQTRFGKIKTIKITPKLIAGTVFDPDDKMYVWVTADENKIPLRVSASIIIGKVQSELIGYENLRNASLL